MHFCHIYAKIKERITKQRGVIVLSYIKINDNKCKSCYLCIEACPFKLIQKSETIGKTGEPIVEFKDNNSKCIGCASCAKTCPDMAITEVWKG